MRHLNAGLAAALFFTVSNTVVAQDEENADAQPQQAQVTVEQYDALLKDVTGLEVYNALLARQIEAQAVQMQQLEQAITEVPELERQIPPLLTRMADALEQFVALDVPFDHDARVDRVAQLKTLIERTDVTIGEKVRRVFEAWTIENEFGRGVEATVGPLDIGGTTYPEVDFLRIGRIAYIYQTPDYELAGAWDHRTRQWVALGSEHRNSIRQALRMARTQVAPDIVLVPVPPPTPN